MVSKESRTKVRENKHRKIRNRFRQIPDPADKEVQDETPGTVRRAGGFAGGAAGGLRGKDRSLCPVIVPSSKAILVPQY